MAVEPQAQNRCAGLQLARDYVMAHACADACGSGWCMWLMTGVADDDYLLYVGAGWLASRSQWGGAVDYLLVLAHAVTDAIDIDATPNGPVPAVSLPVPLTVGLRRLPMARGIPRRATQSREEA